MTCFILVRPQLPENIGAVARAMSNFGISELRLVKPRGTSSKLLKHESIEPMLFKDCYHKSLYQVAIRMAAGGKDVIENAIVYQTTKEAIADLNVLYATTARRRDMVKPIMNPERMAENVIHDIHNDNRTGILFGPERTGLDNDDIVFANAIIEIPTNPDYSSLNIAQSAVVIAYSLFSKQVGLKQEPLKTGKSELATAKEITDFYTHLEGELEKAEYFKSESKKEVMIRNIRNIFARTNLTDQEVRTLRGIIKTLSYSHYK